MCLEGNSPHNTDCTQSVLYTWAFQNLPPSLASMSFNNLAAVWGSMECTCAPQGTCIAAVLLQFNSFTLEPTLFECTFMFPEWAFKFYPFKFVKSSGLSLLLRSTHSIVYVKWSPPEPHMKLGQMVTSVGGGRRHQIIIVAKVYQIKRERRTSSKTLPTFAEMSSIGSVSFSSMSGSCDWGAPVAILLVWIVFWGRRVSNPIWKGSGKHFNPDSGTFWCTTTLWINHWDTQAWDASLHLHW